MIRDTWRAILVVAVVTILRHDVALWRAAGRAVSPPPPAPAPVYGNVAPVHGNVYQMPPTVYYQQPQAPAAGPLRAVGREAVDFAEALIGVVKR